MSYKDRCRTCLSSGKEMRHVHTVISIAGKSVKLSEILKTFYNYMVTSEDFYPENICINCVHQLTITYSFKVLIEASAKTVEESYKFVDSTNSDNNDCSLYYDDHVYSNFPRQHEKRKSDAKEVKSKIEKELLFCVECKTKFHSVVSLKEHCIENHPVKLAIGRDCEYCNEKFDDFRSLVLHRKLHMKPYLCENCWEGFYNIDSFNSHTCEPSVHKTKEKSDRILKQCDQCGKSYPSGYIKIHMLTHSSNRAYSCMYCPKKFKVPGSLHSHILWNHKRTRNHKCEVCNATFISASSRSSHVRKNHLKETKYGCESCHKRFFSKSELQRHSLTHTGVKNFHCHLCDKSYQTRYGLNVHLKSHTQTNISN